MALPDALPHPCAHREREVAALGPGAGALEQDHQRGLALAGPGAQVARRGQAGPAGWPHQDRVDAGEEIAGRLGPPAAGMGHEDDAAQIQPEVRGRHHARVGQADGGAPASGGRRRGQQGQCERGGPVARRPAHGGGRPAPQDAAREERGQRRRDRQGPPGHRRDGPDPVGQPGGELPRLPGLPGTGRQLVPGRAKANICSHTTERRVRSARGGKRPGQRPSASQEGRVGDNAARMCGRFALYTPPAKIARYFGATLEEDTEPGYQPSWNVAPTDQVLGVRDRPPRPGSGEAGR